MHRLTARILDVSNLFQNKKFPINERVYVSTPPYYLYWFEKYYPNIHLNKYYIPFFLQCIDAIQGRVPAVQKWNQLLDAVVTILKYRKTTIYHGIYIKVLSDGTVSYLIVYNDDVTNPTNNETAFPKLRSFFE